MRGTRAYPLGRGRKLHVRFALLSLVVFLAAGAFLHLFIARQVRDEHQQQASFHAVFVTDSILSDALSGVDLTRPVTGATFARLQALVRSRVLVGDVFRVKVWRPDGTVVFSDEPRLVGMRFPEEATDLREVLTEGPNSQVTDLRADEDLFERPLAKATFATYARLPGRDAIAELYQNYEPTAAAARHSLLVLDAVMFGALLALYAFLLPLASRTSREIRDSERRFRAVAENAADAIVSANESGNIEMFNPSAEAMFGARAEDMIGKPVTILMPQRFRPLHEAGFARYVGGGNPHMIGTTQDLVALRSDGSEFPIEISFAAWRARDGQHFTAIMRDATERKRTEEQMQAALDRERLAHERLRGLDEMKNAILTAVSHELRTPLASVVGYASTLQRHGEAVTAAQREDMLRRLSVQARKLQRLLADLLDVDRLARGVVTPRMQPVEMSSLIHGIVSELELEGRDITIDADGVTAFVDPPKVERIVENLVTNAARHAPGSPIAIKARRTEDGMLIVVEDHGPGVPEDMRAAIFEPFVQGPSATPHSPGAGIGLSLVARFAELHGGRAWVEDAPGGGAAFKVFLPNPAPLDADEAEEAAEAAS